MSLYFVDLLRRKRISSQICLVRAPTKGGKAWYYVHVKPDLMDTLIAAVRAGGVNLLDFGEILKSGFGENPPDSAQHEMKSLYDFEATK